MSLSYLGAEVGESVLPWTEVGKSVLAWSRGW